MACAMRHELYNLCFACLENISLFIFHSYSSSSSIYFLEHILITHASVGKVWVGWSFPYVCFSVL